MKRAFYLDLARNGLRMPIGADLVLHERPNPDAVVRDGRALGRVVEETARQYQTPLAFAHMDLQLEKTVLLELLGVPAADIPLYHFPTDPGADATARVARGLRGALNPALQAHIDSVAYVASTRDLVPIGMTIGPFSLMTKLLKDPITPRYLAGSGVAAAEDPDVALLERALELSLTVVRHSVAAQVQAGARAVFMAEPAANLVYVSPRQIEAGSDVFERYAISADRQIKAFLSQVGVDLIFHCCGKLNEYMLRQFCTLEPVLLSLGSSRKLWKTPPSSRRTSSCTGTCPLSTSIQTPLLQWSRWKRKPASFWLGWPIRAIRSFWVAGATSRTWPGAGRASGRR